MERLSRSKERVKKLGEVFTPDWMVKKMCDMLEENDPEAFYPGKTFLEPSCGTGNFLVEILRRKLNYCKNDKDCLVALSSIYGVDLMPDNVEDSRARMLKIFTARCKCTNKAKEILNQNIICANFLKIADDICAFDGDWFAENKI